MTCPIGFTGRQQCACTVIRNVRADIGRIRTSVGVISDTERIIFPNRIQRDRTSRIGHKIGDGCPCKIACGGGIPISGPAEKVSSVPHGNRRREGDLLPVDQIFLIYGRICSAVRVVADRVCIGAPDRIENHRPLGIGHEVFYGLAGQIIITEGIFPDGPADEGITLPVRLLRGQEDLCIECDVLLSGRNVCHADSISVINDVVCVCSPDRIQINFGIVF